MNTNEFFKSVFYKFNCTVSKVASSYEDISSDIKLKKPSCAIMYNDKVHDILRSALKYKSYAPSSDNEYFKYTGIYWIYAEKKYKHKHFTEVQLKQFLNEELPKSECIQNIVKSKYKNKNMTHIVTSFNKDCMAAFIHSGVELNRESAKTIALRFFEAFLTECIKYMDIDDYDYPYVYHIYPHGEYSANIFVLGKNDINYQVSISGKTHDIVEKKYMDDEAFDLAFYYEDAFWELKKKDIEEFKKKFGLTNTFMGVSQ